MIVRKLKKAYLALLIILCLTALLSSCSHAVEFTKDQATYNGETYDLYSVMSPNHTMWFPLPTEDQAKMIGRTAFWPIRATSYDPIVATNEEPADFLIICADGSTTVSKDHSVVLICSDLELPSVFETAFGSVKVVYGEYGNDVPEKKLSVEFPAGTTFDDIVGDIPYIMYTAPKEWKYYCTLSCTHPEIDYLVCDFTVITANDKLYLRVTTESYEDIYYLLTLSQN